MALEYWVYNEIGEFISGPHRKLTVAERSRDKARAQCAAICGTDGEESSPGRGNFACGVLAPHGIHIQVLDGDRDVSHDPMY